jgi:hypothetical protein
MKLKFIVILILFISLKPSWAQIFIDVESGLAFQPYNNIRIPNEGGTFFDFTKELNLQGPVIPFRLRVGYTFAERNHISALFAPLGLKYEGVLNRPIFFENSLFMENLATEGFYKFNSYRLTYRRDFIRNDTWILGAGFTAKIRDASVRLSNESGVSDRNDDLGFVPLIHLFALYRFGNASVIFEGDGLAGGPGRAFDLFLGGNYGVTDLVFLKAGYRMLEGGADVQIYNFTLVHFAVVGVTLMF